MKKRRGFSMNMRRGFSLPELMISLLVLAVVGGAIYESLRRQQQVFRSIALMVAVRGDVRDAAEVVAADLAAASPLDTLPLVADSAVEFYSAIAASLTCDSAPGYTIRMPPEKLQSGYRLTTLLATPDSGDVLLVFNYDSAATAGEPRWDRHAIASVSSRPASFACPPSTGFTTLADATAPSYVITLKGAASAGVRAGAPVRLLRRTRYSLYRSSDSDWYLGSRRCNPLGPSACNAIQPLSGPYAPYSRAGGQSGIALRYFDVVGASLLPSSGSSKVSRVEVTVRARSRTRVTLGTTRSAPYVDSTALSIALRNHD